MRGSHRVLIGFAALAVAAGAVVAVQLAREPAEPRLLGAEQLTTSSSSTTPPPTPTTTSPLPPLPPPPPTPPPPPPAPPPPTTSKPKPKPKPKPAPKPAVGAPCNDTARACIDLSANRSWLLEGGRVVYGPVPITHGRPGYRTPPGTFRVGWKDIDHKSSIFDNAPMPYSVFFNGGIAFHAGSLSETSHGCIHLSNAAAKMYYNTLKVGDIVQVVR